MTCIFFIISCKQEGLSPKFKEKPAKLPQLFQGRVGGTYVPYWGYMELTAVQVSPDANPRPQCGYGGYVLSNDLPQARLDGGTMQIGNIEMQPDANNRNRYGTTCYSTKNGPAARPLFGQTITYTLAGNSVEGIPAFTTSFYVPKLFEASFYVNDVLSQMSNFKQNSTMKIAWNPDSNNELGVLFYLSIEGEKGVGFRFEYEVLPDNGLYNVNYTKYLADIPVGTYFEIGIARGNGKILTNNQREFLLGATSICMDHFVMAE